MKVLLSRFGRKSETTLGIAGLQLKIRAFAGATADQLDAPSGASHAGNRQRRRREHADAPACDGGRRLAEVRRLGLTPPAPYGDADQAGAFRRKLKPAEAVMESRATSATTAPSPPCRNPSSKQASTDFSSDAST